MGRAGQERMTGKTFEQRKKAAEGFSIKRFFRNILRINKAKPTYYPNYRRDGVLKVNPNLRKQEDDV